LDKFYTQIIDKELEAKLDIGDIVRKNPNHQTLNAVLQGIDEFREFVVYLINRE
jgi:hypothetical protein